MLILMLVKAKALIIFFTIMVLGFLGWFFFIKADSSVKTIQETKNAPKEQINTDTNLVIGDIKAPVTLTEYADYKCPTCNNFFKNIEPKIKAAYVDKGLVKIIVKQFPHIGLDAKPAAIAAYCANEQGRFRDFHYNAMSFIDKNLFSKGNTLSDDVFTPENLKKIAEQSKVKTDSFEKCLDGEDAKALVERDLNSTVSQQITGTPTFIIGEQRIIGAQPYEIFRALIEQQLGSR